MGRFTRTGALLAIAWLGCAKDDAGEEEFNGPAGDSPLEEPGSCEPACVEPRDCCDALLPDPALCYAELGTYPFNFSCTAGLCEHLGCSSDADCSSDTGLACTPVNGIGVCIDPCEADTDCEPNEVCDLDVTDIGLCRGACTSDADCPDIARCEDTRCVYEGCTSDEDCALFHGGTCQADGSCSCRTNSECDEFHACAPS